MLNPSVLKIVEPLFFIKLILAASQRGQFTL